MLKLFIPVVMACLFLFLLSISFADQGAPGNGKGRSIERIAFSSSTSGSWQLWSIDPDGKNFVRQTHSQAEHHYPSWSPSKNRLAFPDNERNIWLMKLGENPQKLENLPPNCNHPSWSPSGKKFVFVAYTFENRKEDSDLWIFDMEKNTPQRLMQQDGIQSFPDWSPDGKAIVYTSGYRVDSARITESLWLVNADGTNPRQLVSGGSYNIQSAWAPDGTKIAWASNKSGNMNIWVVDKDGKNQKQLTFDTSYDADPNWSPDGTKICFTSTRSGKMQIWTMDSDGKNAKQLTGFSSKTGESMHPSW